MKKLFLSLAILAGMIVSAQGGSGQQVPKPPKDLFSVQDDTGAQTIDKHKKLDAFPDTGGNQMPIDAGKKLDFETVETGGMKLPNDGAKKLDLVETVGTGGVKLPPEGKEHDWVVYDTGGRMIPKGFKKHDLYETGGTIPAGAGNKYHLLSALPYLNL